MLFGASLCLKKRKTKYQGRSRHELCRSKLILICSSLLATKTGQSCFHVSFIYYICVLYLVCGYMSPMPPCGKLIWSIISLSCPSFKRQELYAPPSNPPRVRLSVSQTTESTALLCMKSQSTRSKYQSAFQLQKQFHQLGKIKRRRDMTNVRS